MEKNTSALKGKNVQPALGTIVPFMYCQEHYPPYKRLQVPRRPLILKIVADELNPTGMCKNPDLNLSLIFPCKI